MQSNTNELYPLLPDGEQSDSEQNNNAELKLEQPSTAKDHVVKVPRTGQRHRKDMSPTLGNLWHSGSSNGQHHMSLKYGQWSWRQMLLRRKMLLLLLLMLLLLYVHLTLQERRADDEEDPNTVDMENFVPVMHQSQVLGMRVTASKPSPDTFIVALTSTKAPQSTAAHYNAITLPPKGFLVWSDHCKIEDLDPNKHEVMRHFTRHKYKACSSRKPLTKLQYNQTNQRYIISISKEALDAYNIGNSFTCCYMGIERYNESKVTFTDCQRFKRSVLLENTTESVIVKCKSGGKEIYTNAHATVPELSAVRETLNKWAATDAEREQRTPSVLLIGIDSISRVNLIRAMPKTAQYLYDNNWFELAGYNKVEDNTFPNIMALTTGYNLSEAMKICKPYSVGGLDKCDFIWKLYRKHGYVTAYGEDAVKINTFNYLKKGFKEPPVDYYMRPFLTAAEKMLHMDSVSGLPECLGFKHAAEHVYDYALEFTRRFKNDSFFGFFWTNTHSHSDISQSTSMDDYLNSYLQKLVAQGTMKNTIVIFFSDHGLRFGPTRATWSGHMEERLPFIFIWLPTYIKEAHPEFVNALNLNRNRLTNPYDLHITLKHILTLSGRAVNLTALGGAKDCPQCQSLLLPVSQNRSCEDIAIEDHWCTCHPYDNIYKDSKTVQMLVKRVVRHINDFVLHFHNGTFAKMCQPLAYMSVKAAYRAHPNAGDAPHVNTYRLLFYTKPNRALYEATVRYNDNSDVMTVTGGVSRLNMYNGEADCMNDFAAKKYCYCRNKSG